MALAVLLLLGGCAADREQRAQKAPRSEPAPKTLNLCSSMARRQTEVIAEDFRRLTGVKVDITFLPAGTVRERLDFLRQNKFDVWLGGMAEEYYAANEENILQPYLARGSHRVPAELKDRKGDWTSVYISYIAFLSNTDNLKKFGLYAPEKWEELLDKSLKDEIVMPRPELGGTSFSMLTSIWQLRGKEQALKFAARFNAQEPLYTDSIGEAVDMIYIGTKTIAVIPLDYALLMEYRHRHLFASIVKDANRNILSGAAIMRNAENLAAAQSFLDYLMSDDGETVLRRNGFYYIWHVKNYPYKDDRRDLIGNVQVPVDDLSWTSEYKNEIIHQWLGAADATRYDADRKFTRIPEDGAVRDSDARKRELLNMARRQLSR